MEFDEEDVVEGELVLVSPGEVVPATRWYERPAVQTAAAAATGVVAGGAALMLARRLGGRAARAAAVADRAWPVRDAQHNQPMLRTGTYLVHIRVVTRP